MTLVTETTLSACDMLCCRKGAERGADQYRSLSTLHVARLHGMHTVSTSRASRRRKSLSSGISSIALPLACA